MDNKTQDLWNELCLLGTPKGKNELKGKLINLTPHDITIILDFNKVKVIKPSGIVARIAQSLDSPYTIDGVPVYKQYYGKIEELPPPKKGIYYIVSSIVKTGYEHYASEGKEIERYDLLVPNNLVRDDNGVIIGCKSLVR